MEKIKLKMILVVWAHQCVYFENITNSQVLKCHHLSPSTYCICILSVSSYIYLHHSEMKHGTFGESSEPLKAQETYLDDGGTSSTWHSDSSTQDLFAYGVIRSYHVDAAGSLAEDHEVCHSQRSCDGHKVFQHVLFPNLKKKSTNRSGIVHNILRDLKIKSTLAMNLHL